MFATLWKKLLLAGLLLLLLFTYLFSLQIPIAEMGEQIKDKYYLYKARQSLQCSETAPTWLREVAETTLGASIYAGQVAFVDNKGKLSHCEYGYQDGRDGSLPITVNTRFKYASISKITTAEAILSLVRNHQLQLDDHLIDILDIDTNTLQDPRIAKITIRDLLAHTAGFDRDKSGDPIFTIRKNVWCPRDISRLADIKLDYDPSSERHYSNLGYCLLGAVLSKKSGQDFATYMNIHFDFDVLNMRYAVNDKPFDDEVVYYFAGNDLSEYMKVFDFDGIQSSAGLTGSASSLVTLAHVIVNQPTPNILSTDTRFPCKVKEYQECYGLGSFKYQPSTIEDSFYIRNGSLPGFTGSLIMKPNVDVVAFLGNTRSVNNEKKVVREIEEKLMQGLDIQKKSLEQ